MEKNILSANLGSDSECPLCQNAVRAHLLREASKAEKRLKLRNGRSTSLNDEYSMTSYFVEDGPLDPSYNYTAFVEVIVSGGNTIGRSPYMSPRKPGESMYVKATPINAILVSVLGILSGLVLVAIFLLFALIMLRRYSKRVAATQGGVEMDLRRSLRHFCSTFRRGTRDHSQYLITPETTATEIGPIARPDLVQAFLERHKDSDYGFQAEFEQLPDRFSDRTTVNCEMQCNRVKNRYPDIKSYDQTRVKLTEIEGVEGLTTSMLISCLVIKSSNVGFVLKDLWNIPSLITGK